jgi:hypothetical protein
MLNARRGSIHPSRVGGVLEQGRANYAERPMEPRSPEPYQWRARGRASSTSLSNAQWSHVHPSRVGNVLEQEAGKVVIVECLMEPCPPTGRG